MTDGPSDEETTGEGGAREVAEESADDEVNRPRDVDRNEENGRESGTGREAVAVESEVDAGAPDVVKDDADPTDGNETGDAPPDGNETGDAPPDDNEPGDAPPDDNEPGDAPPDDNETGDTTPADNETADAGPDDGDVPDAETPPPASDVPPDVRKYDKFKKIDGGTYDRANEFLRDRTYITAREWAIARLCADFRTETGVEMTKIGENLPELVPFMTDTYTPQAVNQARASFEEKVRKSGATFLYGAMCDFFTAQELDDVMYESTEVAKFLLEVEGVELSVDDELEAEDRISEVMREVREHSAALRHDEMTCPECGHEMNADE